MLSEVLRDPHRACVGVCPSLVHKNGASADQEAGSCNCSVRSSFTRSTHHRPHPLPIQWLHVRHPDSFAGLGQERVDNPHKRHTIRRTVMLQAYLSLLGTSIFRLSAENILPPLQKHVSTEVCQYSTAWDCSHRRLCCSPGSLCGLGPVGTVKEQTVPVFTWTVSRILGTKCMGDVLIH